MTKLSKIIIALVFLISVLMIIGCGITKEITEIKPVIIKPAVIEDSIKTITKTDTVIVGVDVIKNDTVTIVKYFPKLEKFYVKAKPDSIIFFDTIKTTQTIEKVIETPFLSKIGLVVTGILICAGIYFLLKLKNKLP